MIEINGLTQAQVAMLDEMWACDTYEEFEQWLDTLTPHGRAQALRLQNMLILAELDQQIARDPLTEARAVLAQFRLIRRA